MRLNDCGQHSILILGVPVSLVDMRRTVDAVTKWARHERAHMVFVRDVASLMLAVDQPELLALHFDASLVVPDGMPLVWVSKFRGYTAEVGRVAGADLVDAVCAATVATRQSHFFYGGKPGVAEEMARRLSDRHPGIVVAGILTPPMREIGPSFALGQQELMELEAIREADPDFIWVGMSSPKQEYWMALAAPLVGRGVLLGVGAAFNFHSGAAPRAPVLMRYLGAEWLHRLICEPRRLWKRYLLLAPRFLASILREEVRRLTGTRRQ